MGAEGQAYIVDCFDAQHVFALRLKKLTKGPFELRVVVLVGLGIGESQSCNAHAGRPNIVRQRRDRGAERERRGVLLHAELGEQHSWTESVEEVQEREGRT